MRRIVVVLTAFGILQIGRLLEPTWELTKPPGQGCWPPQCAASQLPLATPVLTHAGRLLMIGDGAAPQHVFESTDGKRWRSHAHDARWGVRYKSADVSHAGAVWRLGGFVEERSSRTPMNDIWRSVDGKTWKRVLANAPWTPRANAHGVSFRDTLWLIGGEPNDGRIWKSADGVQWSVVEAPNLPRTNAQQVVVHRNALWIVGHGAWDTATNDIWTSSNGESWTQVTRAAGWEPRTAAGVAVLGDRLWVVGGSGHRDVWSSADGREWHRAAAEMPGPPRAADFSTVFQNRFCVFGGKTGGLGGTGFWDGVVCLALPR